MAEHQPPRLLVVGPLPPPVDGTSVSFELFCSELRATVGNLHLEIVDSSPRRLKEDNHKLILADVSQALRIVFPFVRRVRSAKQVLIFGSNGFLLRMAPLLVVIAKLYGKRCFIRPFGGSFDRFHDNLAPLSRRLLLFALRQSHRLIVQTELLRTRMTDLVGDKVTLAPGYRRLPGRDISPPSSSRKGTELRLGREHRA